VQRAGTQQPWPQPLADGTLLVCLPKGIYKPAWSEYALSVRETLNSPYPDNQPVVAEDGSWTYRYFQESLDVENGRSEYTNRALLQCLADGIPVGVMRQISGKPHVLYHIVGLGLVTGYQDGYFTIRSC
jgi:hypothetical protein